MISYCWSVFAGEGSRWCGRAALTGDHYVTVMADD